MKANMGGNYFTWFNISVAVSLEYGGGVVCLWFFFSFFLSLHLSLHKCAEHISLNMVSICLDSDEIFLSQFFAQSCFCTLAVHRIILWSVIQAVQRKKKEKKTKKRKKGEGREQILSFSV